MQALCETCFTSTVVELRSQCLNGPGLTTEKLQSHNRNRGPGAKSNLPMAQSNSPYGTIKST